MSIAQTLILVLTSIFSCGEGRGLQSGRVDSLPLLTSSTRLWQGQGLGIGYQSLRRYTHGFSYNHNLKFFEKVAGFVIEHDKN